MATGGGGRRDDDKTSIGGHVPGGDPRQKQPDPRGGAAGPDQRGSPFDRPTQNAPRPEDRTVIGGPLPPPARGGGGGQVAGSASPFDAPPGQSGQYGQPAPPYAPPGQPLAPGAGSPFGQSPQQTNVWGQQPPGQPQPQYPQQSQPGQWGQTPQGSGGTWLGGPVQPQSGQPGWPQQQQPGYPPQTPTYGQPYQQPPAWQGGHGIGAAQGNDRGFFPDIPRDNPRVAPMQGPKISLQQAMQVTSMGKGASSNPLLAAAASLLILLGRLRTGLVEMQAAPLMDHVTREIDQFERNALMSGINGHEAAVAKYALSGTADDIVQNLPGVDRGDWLQYSMVARFFGKRDSGVGFFQEVEKAMQAPGQNYNLLELMLTCMSLGFEGQYRTMPNGGVELSRIRTAIYETLRRVNQRPDEDISVMWTPVAQGKRRRFAAVSVPAVLGIAAIAVVGFYATLSMLVNRDGAQAAEYLRALHPGDVKIAIERVPGPVFEAENTQLERVRGAFADEIAAGQIAVESKGDYIAIRVGNQLLFDSGAFTVKDEFGPLAARITEVLNTEGGPVLIQGYTDNVPMSGAGRFKNNQDLSLARAESVGETLAPTMDDAARIKAEGKGEADPVGDNATPDGRGQNRRVEIMLAREGTY